MEIQTKTINNNKASNKQCTKMATMAIRATTGKKYNKHAKRPPPAELVLERTTVTSVTATKLWAFHSAATRSRLAPPSACPHTAGPPASTRVGRQALMQRFDSFVTRNWQPLLEDARRGPRTAATPAGRISHWWCCHRSLPWASLLASAIATCLARAPSSQRLPCAPEARPCWTLSDPARRSAGRLRPLPINLQRFTSPLPFSFTPDEVAEALAQPSAARHPGCQASRPITSKCFSAILTRCQQTKKMKNRAHTRQTIAQLVPNRRFCGVGGGRWNGQPPRYAGKRGPGSPPTHCSLTWTCHRLIVSTTAALRS